MKKWVSEHPYIIPVVYFIVYFPVFFLLESFIEPKYIIHCGLDDWIPFCEWFVIPYFIWFLLVPATLFIYMVKDRKHYFKLCGLLFCGMTFCLLMYIVFPNGLNLRMEIPRDNMLCRLIGSLYQVDTATNVCPSIHVSSTTSILYVNMHSDYMKKKPLCKLFSWILTVLICLSTMFLKQHSVVDVILGILVTVVLGRLIFVPQKQVGKSYSTFTANN